MNIELEIKDIKHDLNYAKKCEYDHVTLDVYKVQTLLTAYEKEKALVENHKVAFEKQTENLHEVEALYQKEKEIIKNAICFLKYYNKDFNKMGDNEIKQILYNFGKCADIKKEE